MSGLSTHSVLAGRYRLTRRIAIGGMGEVWRAEDEQLHRVVAVKVLKTEFSSDPTFIDRFRAEARTTALLSHPGIARALDYGETADPDLPTAYLVMELVEGEPLSAVLVHGPLPVGRTLDIIEQAATAMHAAHEIGLVHRDIKPGNLIMTPEGRVKITDFGVARVAFSVPLTQHGMVVGTAQYFPPEQAAGGTVGPASDVYSLGVVAYECLAGHVPFNADNPLAVAMMQIRNPPPPLPPHVSGPVRAMVQRALAKDPAMRFATGAAFAAAVRDVRAGRYPPPPQPRMTPAGTHPAGSHPVRTATPAGQPMLPGTSGRRTLPGTSGRRTLPGTSGRHTLPGTSGRRTLPGASGRRSAALLGAAGLVVAATGATIAVVLLHGSGDGSTQTQRPGSPASSAVRSSGVRSSGVGATAPGHSEPAPTADGRQAVVDPERLIGRPVGDVVARLRSEHLRAQVTYVRSGAPAGSVTAVRLASGAPIERRTMLPWGTSVEVVAEPERGSTPHSAVGDAAKICWPRPSLTIGVRS
ncbi:MAG: serine/threonine protein kinase [Pseudonocardiales bacterium]|nr:MAG: serine/threonine protein kinase [Pseudonocardiales bacterium]